MSRKLRTPKVQVLALPSPSWTYALLVGADPGPSVRLRGWVKQAQGGLFGEPDADEVWHQHREALMNEAEAHGFEPAYVTRRTPSGPVFEQWKAAFLQDNSY